MDLTAGAFQCWFRFCRPANQAVYPSICRADSLPEFRYAPVATKFRRAAKRRDVPTAENAHFIR